jgi:monoamine oxidase
MAFLSSTDSEPDVVVIGAGAAGIAATRTLIAARVNAVLIEARARIGGRAHTDTSASPYPVDLGAGWLHSADRNPLVKIAEDHGFVIDRTTPPWQKTMQDPGFSLEDQRAFRATQARFYERLEKAAQEPLDRPASDLLEPGDRWNALLDAQSTYVNGVELAHLSVKDFDNYHATDVNFRVERGYGALIAHLGRDLPMRLASPVSRIDHSGKRIRIEAADGVLSARCVIVAVPTNIIARESLRFDPPLPDKVEAAARLPLGHDNKLFLSLDDAEEFQADSRIYGARDRVETANYHVRPFGRPMIEAYFGGALARDLEREGLAGFGAFAIDQLVANLGSDFSKRIKPIIVSGWSRDPFASGSYSHALPGYWDRRAPLRAPVDDRLFFAGEAVSSHDFSTVHGAWETGVEAAHAVLSSLKRELT